MEKAVSAENDVADPSWFGSPLTPITADGNTLLVTEAMKLNVADFIEKLGNDTLLAIAVHHTLAQVSRRASETNAVSMRMKTLSGREKQVLTHLANGNSNKSIARDLGISARTVEVHRSHVMTKMHARNFADLIRMAVAMDLVD